MARQDILFLIEKYLENTISDDELTALNKLMENEKNAEIFKNLVKDDYQLKTKNLNFNPIESLKRIESKINDEKAKPKIRTVTFYKYAVAASILLVASLTIYLTTRNEGNQIVKPNEQIIVNTEIKPGTDKATLTLEDGTQIALEKGKSFKTAAANSDGKEITYKTGKGTKVVFNYLTIPRGGEYQITLSDGTRVWLNSESQLKYPVNFIEGEPREVELVYGEAYFDVSPSIEHKGSKFKVINSFQEVEVFGTEFNIKAYKDENNIYTTLVEGGIAVSFGAEKQDLSPGEQSNWNSDTNSLQVNKVNVYNEISWKDGIFSFRKKSLAEIMKVLSRWYDMDVEFADASLEQIGFNGVLGKDQKIEDILTIIKNFGVIKDFEITDKTVILK